MGIIPPGLYAVDKPMISICSKAFWSDGEKRPIMLMKGPGMATERGIMRIE